MALACLAGGCKPSKPSGDPAGGDPAGGAKQGPPRVLFLLSEDPANYEAHRTIPPFAEWLAREQGLETIVLLGEGEQGAFRFPRLEEELPRADLVVIFFRRCALPVPQLELIQEHLARGKPLVGIRTANHAFSLRTVAPGHRPWWEFVPEVLGCENRGYGPDELGAEVAVVAEAAAHPILLGVEPTEWHSNGSLYLVAPLVDPQATVLLRGAAEDHDEPVAWTRMAGNSRIFYTSLGHPDDFETPPFRRLLAGGIRWALERGGE